MHEVARQPVGEDAADDEHERLGDLAHREDDPEIGGGADVEHGERERDAREPVADRRDHGAAEEQAEVALLERAEVLSHATAARAPAYGSRDRGSVGACSSAPTSRPPAASGPRSTAPRRSAATRCRCSRRARACGGRRTTRPRPWRDSASAARRRGSRSVVCHALYLVNLASPDPVIYEKSVAAMRASLEAADAIGAEGVIFHVGSHLGAGFDDGARAGRAGAARAARADDGRSLAADGELGRHRRHDRSLDRRARRDLRGARPSPAARGLPRLLPLVRVGRRRHRRGGARRRRRRPRPPDRARPAPLPPRQRHEGRRSARTATGTTRSARG